MKVPLLMGCVAVVGAIALASIVWSLAAMNRRRTAGLVAALYGLALTYLSVILALFAVNGPFCNPLDQPCPEYRMGIVDVVPVAVAGILALVCFGVAVRVWIRPRNDRRPGAYRHLGEGVAR